MRTKGPIVQSAPSRAEVRAHSHAAHKLTRNYSTSDTKMILAGAQIVEHGSVAYSQGPVAPAPLEAPTASGGLPVPTQLLPEPAQAQGLARVPTTDPVDIHFSNITCTVKLGINKGECLSKNPRSLKEYNKKAY